MYIESWALLLIYTMAATSLILSLYNFLDYKDIIKRLSHKQQSKNTYKPPTVTTKKSKGHWD